MRLKIRDEILSDKKLSYVDAKKPEPIDPLDCGAGYNPYGAPKAAVGVFSAIGARHVNEYPHGMEIYDAIIENWADYVRLSNNNIILTDGSIGSIYAVNSAFSRPGAAVLCFSPQFTDYMTNAKYVGLKYNAVRLAPERGYKINAMEMVDAIDDGLSLIYIDNPNNPTGQSVPLDSLRLILDKANDNGVCVLVDEAYGDYMDEKNSAATLLCGYENLIVLRTFSKGFGLAGIRAGYMMGAGELMGEIYKLCNPFAMSQPSRMAAVEALKDKAFIRACTAKIAQSKSALRAHLKKNLRMAHTLDTCPITLLWHENGEVDLDQEFYKRGILTYSGVNFDNLGKNSVRLRVPHEKDFNRLLRAADEIDALTS